MQIPPCILRDGFIAAPVSHSWRRNSDFPIAWKPHSTGGTPCGWLLAGTNADRDRNRQMKKRAISCVEKSNHFSRWYLHGSQVALADLSPSLCWNYGLSDFEIVTQHLHRWNHMSRRTDMHSPILFPVIYHGHFSTSTATSFRTTRRDLIAKILGGNVRPVLHGRERASTPEEVETRKLSLALHQVRFP